MTIRQIWRTWALLLVVASLIGIVAGGSGNADRRARSVEDRVTDVPALPQTDDLVADRAELARMLLWGGVAAGGAPGAVAGATGGADGPDGEWTLSGVFMIDGRSQVVMRVAADSGEPRLLEAGSTLPDGETIVVIERDRVQLQSANGDESRWVPINREAETPPDGAE